MPEDAACAGQPVATFTIGSSTFLMLPEAGFRLTGWSLRTARGLRDILYWPKETAGQPIHSVRGGNPLLFPFCGRSFDRGVENAWRAPDGQRRPMPRHGFARDGRFQVTARTDNSITGQLVPTEAAAEAYPFRYTFKVSYVFEELALRVILSLENHDKVPIPWSAGHHFYFTLPWHAGASRADYLLRMDARRCAYPGPDGKLVLQQDRETCHDLSDTALVERLHWQLRHNRVSFGPRGGEEDVHLILGTDPVPQRGWTVVTWSAGPAEPFYCVEPWMGPPNAAEHGKGLHWVQPGSEQSWQVEVSLY